ncbi:MAG: Maf family protein, partial [Bdellovibrionota bacterium]
DDAKAMLKLLSGKTHTVLTGYCLLEAVSGGKSRRISRVISSRVKMRKLDAAAIARYVATGEPMDKAGSYGAQGLGMALIEEIRGSYTNVVGLPMAQILSDLEKSFGIPIFPEGSLGGAA